MSKRRFGDEAEEYFSWPEGTKDDPATTCYELGITHPHLNDGKVFHEMVEISF